MEIIRLTPKGIALRVFVQPRSSHNKISGLHGDALKIKLKAPPVEGAANRMCIDYLAKCLKVPKSTVEITAGHTGRLKQVHVHCEDAKTARSEFLRLKRLLEPILQPKKPLDNTPASG